MLIIGAFGMNVVHNPNKYFSKVYASAYSIVSMINTFSDREYRNFSVAARFDYFYNEGLDIYDEYYYF